MAPLPTAGATLAPNTHLAPSSCGVSNAAAASAALPANPLSPPPPAPASLRRPLAPQHTLGAPWALRRMASLVRTAKPALTKAPLAQVGRLGVRLLLRGVPRPSRGLGLTVRALSLLNCWSSILMACLIHGLTQPQQPTIRLPCLTSLGGNILWC